MSKRQRPRPTTAVGLIPERRDKRADALKRLYTRPDYKEHLKVLKFHISMGLTLEEAKAKMGLTKHFWETITEMFANLTLVPSRIYWQHTMRLQERYEQAASLMVRSRKEGDRKTESQMIMLMTKLDDSQIEVAETLGLIQPGALINPETRDVYETMTHEQLQAEYRRLTENIEGNGEDQLEDARPILESESHEIQQDIEIERKPDQLEPLAVDANDTI